VLCAERYRKIADKLEVKEVVVGDGERPPRGVLQPVGGPPSARPSRRALRELEAELVCLADQDEGGHSKRVCALRSSARYGRFLKETQRGSAIDWRHRRTRTLRRQVRRPQQGHPHRLGHGIGHKQRVEEAWRTMKGRPVSGVPLGAPPHPRPIAITVLSLLLERVIQHACQETWRNVRDDLKRIQLAQLSSPNGTVWQVTEPTAEAANRPLRSSRRRPSPGSTEPDSA
jgi:hypothetical protein